MPANSQLMGKRLGADVFQITQLRGQLRDANVIASCENSRPVR